MKKARLLTGLLALALALATAPAVMAQEESPAPAFDPSSIPEASQDEALIGYLWMRNAMFAAGVAEGDIGAATDWLAGEAANLSQADVDEMLAASMLADRDGGDDEFGKAEEDELIGGDDEEEE